MIDKINTIEDDTNIIMCSFKTRSLDKQQTIVYYETRLQPVKFTGDKVKKILKLQKYDH